MTAVDATIDATHARLSEPELREWIREHRASFETVVHREAHEGAACVIGYDLVLTAVCTGAPPLDPADERARAVFACLSQIAAAVLPEDRDEHIGIEAFEPAFHLSRNHDWSPEIRLVVEIRHHARDYFSPTDDAERAELREIEARLASWGIRKTGGV
jgi:hypothetical protein